MAAVSEYLDRAAGRYAWRRVGAGPPLLLLNGYAATAADWDPTFLGELGRSATVICPDHRGMGDSELGDAELSVELMAADALALLDHLGIERAPVAGWSMGGFVGQALAAAAPERVDALVLLATDCGGPAASRCAPEAWERLTDRAGTPREQATRLLGLLFPPPVAAAIDRDFGEIVATARAALDPAALDAQERAMREWYATTPPPVGPQPRLVAAGTLDEVIPPVNAAALAGGDADWRARFAGCGHGFMAQEPARLAALIAAFLGR